MLLCMFVFVFRYFTTNKIQNIFNLYSTLPISDKSRIKGVSIMILCLLILLVGLYRNLG